MEQSKQASFIEAVVNVLVGVTLAFFSNVAIFWFLGIAVSIHDNSVMVLCFTVVSLMRQFMLRRFFEMLRVRGLLIVLALVMLAHLTPPNADENGCVPTQCFDEHWGCHPCR